MMKQIHNRDMKTNETRSDGYIHHPLKARDGNIGHGLGMRCHTKGRRVSPSPPQLLEYHIREQLSINQPIASALCRGLKTNSCRLLMITVIGPDIR